MQRNDPLRARGGANRLRHEGLEPRLTRDAEPVISEFLAVNEGGLQDGFERSPDWIEIYNPSEQAISLQGYSLTDSLINLRQWTFPDVTLLGGEYLVVRASGGTPNGQPDPLGFLHVNFRLGRQGETLALINPAGIIVSQFGTLAQDYPEQLVNISYGPGITTEGRWGPAGYLTSPTPGAANMPADEVLADFVRDTRFSVDRGYFQAPFQVEVGTETRDATIRYTLDGSEPTLEHGQDYTQPITINGTTLLRVRAYRDGWVPTNVDTQTYLFPADVLTQDGAGLPLTWGEFVFGSEEAVEGSPVPANYEIDPDVVHDPRYRDTFLSDLRSLPALSLVVDPVDLWSEATGIYANTTLEGVAWERPASVELIGADGQSLLQIDAGVRIHGGFGRRPAATAKHSFRLFFKGEYGAAQLEYPWFGEDQVDEFDTLVLRANYNYSWARGNRTGTQTGKDYTMINDRWGAVAQQEMGGLASNSNFVHLYLNGLYWGVYNPTERPDASFLAAHLGGLKSEFDVRSHDGVVDGTADSWNELQTLVRQRPLDLPAVESRLDLDNFIDYMILNQFGGNADWPQNNWYASRQRVEGGKWQFHSWDTEFFFVELNRDRINDIANEGVGELYLNLIRDPEFRVRFADRIQRHLLGDGILTPARNIARLDALAAPLDRAVVGESARWGDAWMNQVQPPRTRDDDWLPRLDALRIEYFPQRNAIVLNQYRRRGLWPTTPAPALSITEGNVPPGTQLALSPALPDDVIYYTQDGSDPRLPGGTVSPTARPFVGTLILLNEPQTLIRARSLRGDVWSPLIEGRYDVLRPGDLNRDQQLNAQDIDLLCAAVLSDRRESRYDLNADEAVDALDHQFLVHELLGSTAGDADLDSNFDSADLVLVFQSGQYEDLLDDNSSWGTGDWNCDGDFDSSDLVAAFQSGRYAIAAKPRRL